MKCPLNWPVEVKTVEGIEYRDSDCMKEECAWWDAAHGCCSILAISRTFVAVGNVLGRIADRTTIDVELVKGLNR